MSGGPVPLPLARDPGNALGDSTEGYGWVDSMVGVSLSSQRPGSAGGPGPPSLGQAWAFPSRFNNADSAIDVILDDDDDHEPIDPGDWDGELFQVNSFFDVFFDITVTDVDSRAGRDFANPAGGDVPDGGVIVIPDQGPAQMAVSYEAVFRENEPNFGLIPPPEAFPYIGHTTIEIPLGGDINGNGKPDKIKFTLVSHVVGDEGRSFIILPDGTVVDEFSTTAEMGGAVVDEDVDPPFTIGLTGPTTVSSTLLNPVVPLPGAVWLGLSLLGGMGAISAIRRRKH